jgi:coenzyme PQQ precursor peptide PqqA
MSINLSTGDKTMRWNTPDFEEINLSGEVTAYANTDDQVRTAEPCRTPAELATEQPAARFSSQVAP